MPDKQVDQYNEKIKKMSLRELEQEILNLYPAYLKGEKTDTWWDIGLCLSHRKYIINNNFKFTPNHVKQIERVNQLLTDATAKLLKKAEVLDRQMEAIKAAGDDFLEDYYIEAILKVEFFDEDSILVPDEDENEGQSDYQAMVEVLDEMVSIPFRSFYFDDKENMETNETDDERYQDDMLNDNWNNEKLSVPELSHIPYFCYASHRLFNYTDYSLSDIIRIKAFRNEITVCWVNRMNC